MVIDHLKNTTASLQVRVQIVENKLQLLEEKLESQKQISRQEMASMESRLVNYLDKVSRASIPSYIAINDCHCYRDCKHRLSSS